MIQSQNSRHRSTRKQIYCKKKHKQLKLLKNEVLLKKRSKLMQKFIFKNKICINSLLKYMQPSILSKQPNKQFDDLERIRMLETRMRNKGKTPVNQQSVRTIKSTDSKRVPTIKNKVIIFEQKSNGSGDCQVEQKAKLEQEVKNNRKITQYFTIKSSAKKQQSGNQVHEDNKIQKFNNYQQNQSLNLEFANSNVSKTNISTEDAIKQQNRTLKQKLRIKQESFLTFKNQMKKDMLEAVITIHRLKRNEMKLKVSNNKIRLGEYHIEKKGGDFWVDGSQIKEVKEKLQGINKEKQELEKCKKFQAKKSNKQYSEDPQQWKSSIASQLHFLSREQAHLQQTLKRLEQQKILHIKEYKLLYDEENSKYGRVDNKIGTTIWPKIGQYQLLGLLGKGGFSQVYKAFDTEELREVACKLHELRQNWNLTVRQNFIKHAMREQGVHKMLNHSNIVKLYGTVQIDQSAFCTILEYCQGPDLSYYLKKHKRLPQKQAKMVIRQVINAIKYLHQLPQKVIHYDLKPQNILFHKGKIKITDFGLCKTTNQQIIQLTSQGVGTYWYLPPQCFVTDIKAVITPKVDIWSIGVVYYEMLYGEKPFGNQMSQMRILNEGIMLKANLVNFPSAPKYLISNESKQFIKACLKPNVEQRLDIKQVAAHPLFEKR